MLVQIAPRGRHLLLHRRIRIDSHRANSGPLHQPHPPGRPSLSSEHEEAAAHPRATQPSTTAPRRPAVPPQMHTPALCHQVHRTEPRAQAASPETHRPSPPGCAGLQPPRHEPVTGRERTNGKRSPQRPRDPPNVQPVRTRKPPTHSESATSQTKRHDGLQARHGTQATHNSSPLQLPNNVPCSTTAERRDQPQLHRTLYYRSVTPE